MKSVHVQLANERGIIVVFKEFGNQGPCKFIFIQDNKRVSIVGPSNQFGIFRLIEEAVRIYQLILDLGHKS